MYRLLKKRVASRAADLTTGSFLGSTSSDHSSSQRDSDYYVLLDLVEKEGETQEFAIVTTEEEEEELTTTTTEHHHHNNADSNTDNNTDNTTTKTTNKKIMRRIRRTVSSQTSKGGGGSHSGDGKKHVSPASLAERQRELDMMILSHKVEELSNFDACVEACDALAASSAYAPTSGRKDPQTGLMDCSVLVSPDGDLLLIPTNKTTTTRERNEETPTARSPPSASAAATPESRRRRTSTFLSEHEDLFTTDDDYKSAIFVGCDIHPEGDKSVNGFSAKGWSIPATTLALKQSEQSLVDMARFVEQVLVVKKENCAKMRMAVDTSTSTTTTNTTSTTTTTTTTTTSSLGGATTATSSSTGIHKTMDDYTRKEKQLLQPEQWEMDDIVTPSHATTSSFLHSSNNNNSREQALEFTKFRVGPIYHPASTLHTATMALEQYFTKTADALSGKYQTVTKDKHGLLSKLHKASADSAARSSNRRRALQEMLHRARLMEAHLEDCQKESLKRWEAVYKAEENVTKIMETKLLERSRKREEHRLQQFKLEQEVLHQKQKEQKKQQKKQQKLQQKQQQQTNSNNEPFVKERSPSEIWDIVSSVTEAMEEGSFEPMNLYHPKATATAVTSSSSSSSLATTTTTKSTSTTSTAATAAAGSNNNNNNSSSSSSSNAAAATPLSLQQQQILQQQQPKKLLGPVQIPGPVTLPPVALPAAEPIVSRADIEQEVHLPELRRMALAADEVVEDASGSLLNILSNLDTARRSARIASEASLLSSCHSHADCIKSFIQLERSTLEEQMKHLNELESIAKEINVRKDLDSYISWDRKENGGGSSHLGDDDDAGIASALAVLSSHVDGSMGLGSNNNSNKNSSSLMDGDSSSESSDGPSNNNNNHIDLSNVTREDLEDAVDLVFDYDKTLNDKNNKTDNNNNDNDGIASDNSNNDSKKDDNDNNNPTTENGTSATTDDNIGKKEDHEKAFRRAVELLCMVAEDRKQKNKQPSSNNHYFSTRSRQSTICYALNSKRSSGCAEIKTKTQFDAICRIFSSIFTGCDVEDLGHGVSNAKMCMMLAQTFYIVLEQYHRDNDGAATSANKNTAGGEEEEGFSSSSQQEDSRSKRIFVKNKLTDHPLWSVEEFWDQTLFQCLSESLTHSGVMANFEMSTANRIMRHSSGGSSGSSSAMNNDRRLQKNNNSEWGETRKIKWHDLTHTERIEAASQVHAVVFAQLGALAHSMIEFGCGLERSCAFVRRMAVRNQLPISQRVALLQHLIDRFEQNNTENNHHHETNQEEEEQREQQPPSMPTTT